MNERVKLVLLAVAVVVLVVLTMKIGSQSISGGTSEPKVSPEYLRMSPAEKDKLADEIERQRRSAGKEPKRHLPEDPAGFPPAR